MRNRDNKRGNVATLLIENSSALAILIKSRKSLARSIGQTGKARSVCSPFGNGHSQCPHFTLFPPFALWLSFYYLKYSNRSSRKRQINHISYEGLGIPFFPLMKHRLKIFKSYLIYYNFCYNCKRENPLFTFDKFFFLKHVSFPSLVSYSFLSLSLYLEILHFYRSTRGKVNLSRVSSTSRL